MLIGRRVSHLRRSLFFPFVYPALTGWASFCRAYGPESPFILGFGTNSPIKSKSKLIAGTAGVGVFDEDYAYAMLVFLAAGFEVNYGRP
jgi:hypothetical protein